LPLKRDCKQKIEDYFRKDLGIPVVG